MHYHVPCSQYKNCEFFNTNCQGEIELKATFCSMKVVSWECSQRNTSSLTEKFGIGMVSGMTYVDCGVSHEILSCCEDVPITTHL